MPRDLQIKKSEHRWKRNSAVFRFFNAAIDAAVNRYDRSKDYQFDRTQCVSVLDAIRCYTLHPAYASYQEDLKGSVEVGKLADLIVLSDDILKIDPMEITHLKVDLTMIDGIVEYQRAE